MIGKYILCAALAASTLSIKGGDNINSEYYPDADDTTSFEDAYEFTYGNAGQQYSENFTAKDKYDYIKYTATYSRSIFLGLYATNNKIATAEAFLESSGFDKVVATYTSNTEDVGCGNTLFLRQGETIYFRVKCNGVCNWVGTLAMNINPSGFSYRMYNRMYGYQMPKTGLAYIYYDVDSTFQENVPSQDFTYEDCLREAMDLWGSVGGVTFVKDSLRAVFTCKALNIDDINLGFKQYNITLNTVLNLFEVPNYVGYYEAVKDYYEGSTSEYTIWQAVTGVMLYCCGIALGLVARDDELGIYNVMYYKIHPYLGMLGDGDIAAFNDIWGDKNKYDAQHPAEDDD